MRQCEVASFAVITGPRPSRSADSGRPRTSAIRDRYAGPGCGDHGPFGPKFSPLAVPHPGTTRSEPDRPSARGLGRDHGAERWRLPHTGMSAEGEHSAAWPLCEDSACPDWPRPCGHGLFIDIKLKFRQLEYRAHVAPADRVVPRPVAWPDQGRLDGSGQWRREPVRGRGRPGLRGPANRRRHPGQ